MDDPGADAHDAPVVRRVVALACLLSIAVAAPAAAGADGERPVGAADAPAAARGSRAVDVVEVGSGVRTTVARVPGTDGTLSVAAFPGAELSLLDTTAAASALSVLAPGGGAPLAAVAWPQLGPYATAEPLPGGERLLTTLADGQPLLVNRDGSAPVALGLTRVTSTAIAPDGRVAVLFALPGAPPAARSPAISPSGERWPPGRPRPRPGDTFRLRTVDAAGTLLTDVATAAVGLVRWGPEGLVAVTPEAVAVIDPATGAAARTLPGAWARDAAVVSPDGTRIAAIGVDADGRPASVVLRDAATGALLDAFALPDGRQSRGAVLVDAHALTWSPDGRRLALRYVRTQGRRRTTGVDLLTVAADHVSWRPLLAPARGWRGDLRWSADGLRLALRAVTSARMLPRLPRTCRRADLGLGADAPPWTPTPTALRGSVRCTTARRVAVRYLVLGARAVPAWRCAARPEGRVRCTSRARSFTFTVR